ncbi:MAG TPA: molybdopterin-dependent oxidoreductase [Bradyrhizobium sp.]|uniref:molybdopterin-dependent oxidoreductase n=1 Tax=Bradyrhizobium sp. TaxID=376 RepID=UPI002BDD677C|nr:molybdopterin-dependent oxidoreductase [Bradyrhizobium sp.]HLZ02214.1 molybdopterin-dependent oxidoreductase [Bradyrhizobium sp.]
MSTTTINGRTAPLPDDPDALLIDVIRDGSGLTGTKLVCGSGVCGACTVLLDGEPVVSCLCPAKAAAGKTLTTIEGIGGEKLHPVQKAFMAHDALQCGFCTPGFVVEAAAFHDRWRAAKGTATPSRDEIAAALSGHLCRCGAYEGIYRAVSEACAGRFDGAEPVAPRMEARDKVTGLARYTVDVRHDGQLEGVILRSNVAHARIKNLDLAPARAMAGVAAVISLLPDDNMVRFVGAPIAAVAAKDRRSAREALAAITFDREDFPAVIGLDAARAADAPVVFDKKNRKRAGNLAEAGGGAPTPWKGNVRGPTAPFAQKGKRAKGWISEARAARNPLLVEETFRVSTQQHACLEPHAAVARFDGDRLTVHVSTQAVHEVMEKIAKRYKLAHDKIAVIADHVGGGFGSKGSLGGETIAAIELARAARAPVRVVFDREEELSVAGYRPAAEMTIALLPSPQSGLKALSLNAHADTGVATNSLIAGLARLIYPAEAKDLVDFDVLSNLPPGAPFRGPGGPPMVFALEQAVDEAALRLNVDPIELRKRWDSDRNRQRLYDWAAGLDVWKTRKPASSQSGRYRRGVGMASGYWLYLWQTGSSVGLAIKGGRLVASSSVQDIGTGTRSVIANTVAKAFELEPQDIEVRIGHSNLPEGPGSGGSRVTASVVPPTLAAIEKLKAEIARTAARRPMAGSNAPWRELIAAAPDLSVSAVRANDGTPPAGVRSPLREAGFMGLVFSWVLRMMNHMVVGAGVPSSVQVMEVEVDTWLGHVRVLNAYTGLAVGKLAAPTLARSQAAGALIQGIGYALYETRETDPVTGHVLTGSMEDYRIPGIADMPRLEVHFDEAGFEHVAGGSVGIGEVSTVPTSPAIANAIYNAIGVRPTEIPIRPDRIVAALKGRAAA